MGGLFCHPSAGGGGVTEWLAAAMAEGRVLLDSHAARRCFASVPVRCSWHAPLLWGGPEAVAPECSQMLVGTVAPGGACRLREECAGAENWAAWCDRQASCPGVCRVLPAEGEPCVDAYGIATCRWPFLCGGGFRCTAGGEGDDCSDSRDCWPPLTCLSDGTRRRCGGYAAVGEECALSIGCAPGLYCISNQCVSPADANQVCDSRPCGDGMRCAEGRCGHIVELGDTCDGVSRVCAPLLTCLDGQCTPLPAAGENCDWASCVEGRCIDGTCTLLPSGERCDPASALGECEGYCDGELLECRSRVGDGEWCSSPQHCEADLECVSGVCRSC